MARNEELFNAVSGGKMDLVPELVQKELDAGAKPDEILQDSMIAAMREIGERFENEEAYVPEMLLAARAMQGGLSVLEPALAASGHEALGKVAIGTVKGDLHDIGKNLVSTMLSGAGYSVEDLGINCEVDKFAEAANKGAKVILCSALLTTTMPYMKEVIDHLKENNKDVKVIVGGAPVSQEFADSINADGYGEDANMAVKIVDKLYKAG
ncbi:MAG: corrinoid protein [Victivallales bacterium]|nr:corrinoid protein [Victivallales bacterium]